MTTKKALIVLGFVVIMIVITLIMPAQWVGIKSSTSKRAPLVLKSSEELAVLTKDNDRNSNPDWRDLLIETTSTSTSKVASEYVVSEEDKKRLADPNNLTASFSKNLYTVSSYAKKNGEMSAAEQQDIVANLIEKESTKIAIVTYTVYDIKTLSTDNAQNKKTYGNELGKVFKEAVGFKLNEMDLDKVKAYNTSKDKSILASIVIKKNNAKKILEKLLAMTVPPSAVSYHLLLVNTLSEYMSTLDNLSQADTDPVRAMIVFNNYPETINALYSALTNLQLYFKLSDVTFSQNEPGYVLNSGYTME